MHSTESYTNNFIDHLHVAEAPSPLSGHKSACYQFHFANSRSSPQTDSKHLPPTDFPFTIQESQHISQLFLFQIEEESRLTICSTASYTFD